MMMDNDNDDDTELTEPASCVMCGWSVRLVCVGVEVEREEDPYHCK